MSQQGTETHFLGLKIPLGAAISFREQVVLHVTNLLGSACRPPLKAIFSPRGWFSTGSTARAPLRGTLNRNDETAPPVRAPSNPNWALFFVKLSRPTLLNGGPPNTHPVTAPQLLGFFFFSPHPPPLPIAPRRLPTESGGSRFFSLFSFGQASSVVLEFSLIPFPWRPFARALSQSRSFFSPAGPSRCCRSFGF